MNKYKPELYPNSKVGKEPDVEVLIEDPRDWGYSFKADGGRVQCTTGPLVGRSLKPIRSIHAQRMWADILLILQMPDYIMIEAEFYSHEMTFPEIMHFFRCSDVTSDKEKTKLQKLWDKTKGGTIGILDKIEYPIEELTGEDLQEATKWEFVGRTVEWLTTWHNSLKFYAFNLVDFSNLQRDKLERMATLSKAVRTYKGSMHGLSPDLEILEYKFFSHRDELYQAYDQALLDNYEGLVVMRRDCQYKFGRHSATFKDTFKLKEDNLEFDGQIVEVLEATEAIEGAEKTINELGRSRTSQLKEDRQPSGICKGFKIKLDDGKSMTVLLKGFNVPEKRVMLEEPEAWVGLWIRFSAMAPVKVGGVPRGPAHFTKGNIRDGK